jgi:hypothetical protein
METNKTKEEYRFVDEGRKHLHQLFVNGEWKNLTGVTTILGVLDKPGLLPWASKMACDWLKEHPGDFTGAEVAWKTVRDSAGKSGTDVHAVIEEIIKDVIKNSDGYILSGKNPSPQIQNFLDWAITNKVKFLDSEKNCWNKDWFVGGIADFVYQKQDGKLFVGDIKTAKGIYPTNYIQGSAYAKMLTGMGLYDRFDGVTVVRCGKDGSFEIGENFAVEQNVECFEACLKIYRHLNSITK